MREMGTLVVTYRCDRRLERSCLLLKIVLQKTKFWISKQTWKLFGIYQRNDLFTFSDVLLKCFNFWDVLLKCQFFRLLTEISIFQTSHLNFNFSVVLLKSFDFSNVLLKCCNFSNVFLKFWCFQSTYQKGTTDLGRRFRFGKFDFDVGRARVGHADDVYADSDFACFRRTMKPPSKKWGVSTRTSFARPTGVKTKFLKWKLRQRSVALFQHKNTPRGFNGETKNK